MARSSLLVHIVMVVIAGAIGYLYIYPTIVQIRDNQDMAVLFNREVAQVSGTNSKLQQKLTAINNISLESKQKLVTYMPDTLDDVTFMRTIEAILFASGIEPSALQFGSGNNNEGNDSSSTATQNEFALVTNKITDESTINVAFEVDEASLFSFFSAVELSEVPFVLKEAVLTPTEGGAVSAELIYTVHALASTTSATVLDSSMMEMGTDMGMVDPSF